MDNGCCLDCCSGATLPGRFLSFDSTLWVVLGLEKNAAIDVCCVICFQTRFSCGVAFRNSDGSFVVDLAVVVVGVVVVLLLLFRCDDDTDLLFRPVLVRQFPPSFFKTT